MNALPGLRPRLRKGLPFVYLNVATTADGKLAPTNRHFVPFSSQRDQELLYTAPSRVLKCSVCPNTGRVAMLTAQRQLIVYDTRTRAVHLFVHTATVEHEHAQA